MFMGNSEETQLEIIFRSAKYQLYHNMVDSELGTPTETSLPGSSIA